MSDRFQKQRNQASQSTRYAVNQAERAQEILHQALSIGHPSDIQYAQAKLQEALNQMMQTQSYNGSYISIEDQSLLQQAELKLRQEYQHLVSNDISDLTDRIQDED